MQADAGAGAEGQGWRAEGMDGAGAFVADGCRGAGGARAQEREDAGGEGGGGDFDLVLGGEVLVMGMLWCCGDEL